MSKGMSGWLRFMLCCSMVMLGRPFWAIRRTWGSHRKVVPWLSKLHTTTRSHTPSVQDFFQQGSRSAGDNDNDNDTDHLETIVTFLTDVEGDMAYLDRYVETSKVLEFVDTPTNSGTISPYSKCINFTNPRALLVFGGDVWDKGGHDLYTIRQLLDLKRRYPDRVVFILGNRDVNKLRILQELGLHDPPPNHPGLMWFKGTGRVGDPDSNPPPSNSVERLKWMLANTMGSPDAFDLRKQELEWERNTLFRRSGGNAVTDQDVVESYRKSCHPQGELGQFLSQAQLICRLGPLLFVHGSLPLIDQVVFQKYQQGLSVWDDLTFCMPWLPAGETALQHGVETIDQWIHALNEFCLRNVKQWKNDIARIEATASQQDDSPEPMWAYRGGYHYGPKYSALIQYGMGMIPGGKKNPSVVYNSFTPAGMPHRFYPDSEEPHMVQATKEFFDRAGIQVILAGHKPQGDMPSPIRVDDSSWVLLADTSYSSQTIWHHHGDHNDNNDGDEGSASTKRRRSNLGRGNSLSFRGELAVSEILIQLKGKALESVIYHGVLSDGSEYETINLLAQGKNTTLGQVAPEDVVPSIPDSPHQGRWWTKSVFSDGSHLYHAGEGFNIWNLMSDPPNTKSGSS